MADTIYFSVDVETTGPCPSLGSLLSIGVDTLGARGQQFYATISHGPDDMWLTWDADMSWWGQQDADVWAAARAEAQDAKTVALQFEAWIEGVAPDPKSRCFVANPVAFDWQWINDMFLRMLGRNPFGYRALCIRSMHYGIEAGAEWGEERETWGKYHVPSEVPHHALHDAIAQRKELELLLEARNV